MTWITDLSGDQIVNVNLFEKAFFSNAVTIWILDKSGIQMVQMCQVVVLSRFGMVVWKPDKKCLFYGLKCLVFEWSAWSCDQTIWELVEKKCTKSQIFRFQVFSIQVVTVIGTFLVNLTYQNRKWECLQSIWGKSVGREMGFSTSWRCARLRESCCIVMVLS